MTKDVFRDRERGEEDAYFREQDAKLKARLATVKSNSEREAILKKIHALSPWWQEPAPQG